ncbi:hypothetical protein A9G22_00665 [Gilliamella sp. App2-1]|uniref:hypothetical protein n=1 Tax=Gilliamella sp. App2-1 TaxID=3120230 RepID=UPI0008279E23|nr:hypothetical protein [Gilliamella apicola]OCG25369.1 hypothetical protein A9G22_00665 [Gilliamella apicola]
MQMQLMRRNFSGIQSMNMYMIMKNGIGNTFSALLTSLTPVNIGISAVVASGIALTKAYYVNSQELSNFNRTISLQPCTEG